MKCLNHEMFTVNNNNLQKNTFLKSNNLKKEKQNNGSTMGSLKFKGI